MYVKRRFIVYLSENMKLGYWKVESVSNQRVRPNCSPDILKLFRTSFIFISFRNSRSPRKVNLSRVSTTFVSFHCVNTKHVIGYCKITWGQKSSRETGNYRFHQSFPIEKFISKISRRSQSLIPGQFVRELSSRKGTQKHSDFHFLLEEFVRSFVSFSEDGKTYQNVILNKFLGNRQVVLAILQFSS